MEKESSKLSLDDLYNNPEILEFLDIPSQVLLIESLLESSSDMFPWLRDSYIASKDKEEYSVVDSSLPNKPPISQIADAIFDDQLPSLGCLVLLAVQYKAYVRSEGELTAEKVFFGSPNGRGTYARRRKKEDQMETVFFFFSMELASRDSKKEQISEVELLERMIVEADIQDENQSSKFSPVVDWFKDNGGVDAIDSFLRTYRRWRNKPSSMIINYSGRDEDI